MHEVGYLEAWGEWANGSTEHLELWGQSMLFWGRAGKIAQFVGALTVIAEVVGPKRIRGFAASLRGFSLTDAVARGMDENAVPPPGHGEYESPFHAMAACFGLIFSPAMVILLVDVTGGAEGLKWLKELHLLLHLILLVLSLLFLVLFYLIGVFLFKLGMLAAALVADWLLRAVAWALEQPKLDRSLKAISALLLVVGFHFDLLAS